MKKEYIYIHNVSVCCSEQVMCVFGLKKNYYRNHKCEAVDFHVEPEKLCCQLR